MEVVKDQLEPRSQPAGDGPGPDLDLKLESCREVCQQWQVAQSAERLDSFSRVWG